MKNELTLPPKITETALSPLDYGAHNNDGFESVGRDHVSLPYLSLLQALSPEVAGADAIEGAKPGVFLNSVTKELLETHVILQPVHVKLSYMEWQPRNSGGGKVGEHSPESDVVKQAAAAAKAWNRLSTEAGNDLIKTYQMLCLFHRSAVLPIQEQAAPEPIMLSMSVTKERPYRALMTRLSTIRVQGNRPPLYAHRLLLVSTNETNSAGQPYKGIRFDFPVDNNVLASLIPPASPLITMACDLRAAYCDGAVKIAEPEGDLPF